MKEQALQDSRGVRLTQILHDDTHAVLGQIPVSDWAGSHALNKESFYNQVSMKKKTVICILKDDAVIY